MTWKRELYLFVQICLLFINMDEMKSQDDNFVFIIGIGGLGIKVLVAMSETNILGTEDTHQTGCSARYQHRQAKTELDRLTTPFSTNQIFFLLFFSLKIKFKFNPNHYKFNILPTFFLHHPSNFLSSNFLLHFSHFHFNHNG